MPMIHVELFPGRSIEQKREWVDVVTRARENKLTVADFEGTTISLTNPGTVGTVGSIPRLTSSLAQRRPHACGEPWLDAPPERAFRL